jgi:TRAP-type C4-dicarboxylate transport system substrate-binding protein
VLCLLFVATNASADPIRLRLATAAPDGSSFAREFRAFSRDVETLTHGAVQIKWLFGGIAGTEREVADRIKRDQLDGIASAGMLCQELAPTMRVTRLPGLYRDRKEQAYVFSRFVPVLTQEFAKAGFVFFGGPGLGPDVLFSRRPVNTFAELRQIKTWRWDLDEVSLRAGEALGMSWLPIRLEDALGAYDSGRIDAFAALPTAALAFQWSAASHFVLDLPMDFMTGCLLVANRAFDAIPNEERQIIRGAAAKAIAHLSEVGELSDQQLLGGLFARQGLKVVEPSAELRDQFTAAARAVRVGLGARLVPPKLLQEVDAMLATYRAEHPQR